MTQTLDLGSPIKRLYPVKKGKVVSNEQEKCDITDHR